ncbi:N-acetylglucosamine-6-phosphate deacetylase [Virgibacillus oceani]|uniref:N-acetylglucosamine-6-phosphate deacetylase n=1 Tax=Virgibacillus oceani TaxID=1479511 RepID=A0A917H485_9BACI|nr:N-acetylglucosamine-6-phosphate deacetylase [Virgibacillus oceani]GGG67451.1 N-acetylglucosamine-6-phosphate deacetylase [Virgibacillus oceani]
MSKSTSLYIKNANIYTEERVISDGALLVENGLIKAIYDATNLPAVLPENTEVLDGENQNVIPGFIDGHIHGANGADVMDATVEAIDTMAAALPKEGTTSFLATTITQSPENIDKALKNVAAYDSKPGQAEVIGVHLEGPFIEKSKKGAQPLKYIMEPNAEQFQRWQALSGNKIKTITMAPEHDKDGAFIKFLYENGVNVSSGHTSAGFSDMKQAVALGVRQVTHICNAMNGIHHRDIGVVGAAFQLEQLRAELIADGIHVSPEMLQIIYNNIGSSRLLLITDAMRAKCLQAGNYELGGQPVTVTGDRAVLEDGTLAGSILKMYQGAQNMLSLSGVTIKSIVDMASANPAKQIGVFDRKGDIAVGKDADVLLVDHALNIHYTICRGTISYKGDKLNGNN